jgi:hypothetical protein
MRKPSELEENIGRVFLSSQIALFHTVVVFSCLSELLFQIIIDYYVLTISFVDPEQNQHLDEQHYV